MKFNCNENILVVTNRKEGSKRKHSLFLGPQRGDQKKVEMMMVRFLIQTVVDDDNDDFIARSRAATSSDSFPL